MQAPGESGLDATTDALVGEWLTLQEAAERLGLSIKRTKQLIRDHKLVGVHRNGTLMVPAAFIRDGRVVKGLPGTLTLLADAGYDSVEALRWLFTADDTIPGTPVQALLENRGTEIRRRAQALAF
ncbi:Rv2175c family DNA-binding protein [Thermomonospora catenispora]|uniref:Rv2175c family DNA-binding protein n=1 Tax=Thermomonospora catenispora TaxID=2493090 RepID=UPI0011200153|nr:Rv2175c family DNA-binding protein [Thermomonospora catenispora]TNY36305.1 DNA-binding protein [Thermomonospora catenispora]